MKQSLYAAVTAVALAGVTLAAQTITINGAGATFPAPIYQKWFAEYNKANANIRINYQPLGLGSSRVDLQACKLEYSIVSPK